MTRTAVFLCLCISASVMAQSTRPATQPVDRAVVAKLVTELGADDAAARDGAKEKLAAMGPGITAELVKAVEATSDPEVRTSLQSLIKDMERSDRTKPTLVTLQLKNVPAKVAFEKLSETTGIAVGADADWVWRNNRKTVTIDVEKQPLWVVVTELCAQSGMSIQQHGSAGRISVQNTGEESGRPIATVYKDGFYIVPMSASRLHTVSYFRPKQPVDSFSMDFRIMVDPKVTVLQGPYHLAANEAVDDKGNDLKQTRQTGPADLHGGHFGNSWLWDLSLSLRYVLEQGKTLKSLKMTVPFVIVDKDEIWEIPAADVEKAAKTFNGVTYTMKGLRKQGDGYQLSYAVTWKEGVLGGVRRQRNPLTDFSTIQRMVRIVDADGKVYESSGASGGGGGGKLSYDHSFRKPDGGSIGEPTKIIWAVPLSTKRVEIPIEFQDLPIP